MAASRASRSRHTRESPYERQRRGDGGTPTSRGVSVALIGVVVAGGLAAYGIWSRSDTVAALKQDGGRCGAPPGPGGIAQTRSAAAHADLAGQHRGLVRGADLRPGQRLCVPLVQGLRRAREGGRCPGDHRHPQPGCAVRSLQGEARRGGGPLQAGRDHRQTLGGALGDAGGVAAGCRREGGGCRRAEGAGGCRRAGGRALSGDDRVQATGRAVRRRGDGPAHQYR